MHEVVKYHNDFNSIKIPSCTEYEQNLMMKILVEVKEKPSGQEIVIPASELMVAFNGEFKNNTEIGEYLWSLQSKFFKADFEILLPPDERGLVGVEVVNLFQGFILLFDEPITKPKSEWKNFQMLKITLNPKFEYLINNLTKNFTRFELQEFFNIGGKYTKNLYRLLKQFRNSGKCTIYQHRWQDFCDFMGIPKHYLIQNIDARILKPAIKELAAERNLFNCTRPIFDNLTYKKIKDPKGRGRGGKVIGIEFYFTPESDRTELIEQDKDLKSLDRQIKAELNNQGTKTDFWGRAVSDCTAYVGIYFNKKNRFDGGVDKCKIKDIHEAPDGSIIVQGYNIETQKDFKDIMVFDNLNHMKNSLKPYW